MVSNKTLQQQLADLQAENDHLRKKYNSLAGHHNMVCDLISSLLDEGPSISYVLNGETFRGYPRVSLGKLTLSDLINVPPLTEKNYHDIAQFLYALLDDVDTISDIARGNDKLYRTLVERTQAKKLLVVEKNNGSGIVLKTDDKFDIKYDDVSVLPSAEEVEKELEKK